MFLRRMKWFFSKSGIITLAFEHFLAMVPATIMVPIMVNKSIGANVIDMSLVLLTSGLGTILFSLFSTNKEKTPDGIIIKRIPAYLGSSFAYIGLTIYLLELQIGEGVAPGMAYTYVGWSYMFSGILLVLLSFLYKLKFIEAFFSKCLPAAVIGPAISLIGLELADSAIIDSGIDVVNKVTDVKDVFVAFGTLLVIILLSLVKKKFLKNAAIIAGMVVGWIMYLCINGISSFDMSSMNWFVLPKFCFPLFVVPPNWQRLLISVIPATFIVFTENIGRVTIIHRIEQEENSDTQLFNDKSVKILGRSLFSHGLSSFVASFIGSVPNTLYAENIAVMGIHRNIDRRHETDPFIKNLINPYSVLPFIIAAFIAIFVSFFAVLQRLLINIPKPVIGGMELFLFGIISAPGIQLLVDQRVNYKKVSNQIITAAVLIAGIGEISINIQWFELKGMSLGLVVGFVLNLLVLLLNRVGLLCDTISIEEVVSSCVSVLKHKDEKVQVCVDENLTSLEKVPITVVEKILNGYEGKILINKTELQAGFIRDAISHSKKIIIQTNMQIIKIIKFTNRISIDIAKERLPENIVNIYINDYQEAIDIIEEYNSKEDQKHEYLRIDLSRNISLHKVKRLVEQINWKSC